VLTTAELPVFVSAALTYQPAASYCSATDALAFDAYDGADASDPVTVSITVVCATATTVNYNGPTSVKRSSSFTAKANLNSSDPACLPGRTITFTVSGAPIGSGVTRVKSGQATAETKVSTAGWVVGSYTITAAFAGSRGCLASQDTWGLKVTR
jgi:hypothetical protein